MRSFLWKCIFNAFWFWPCFGSFDLEMWTYETRNFLSDVPLLFSRTKNYVRDEKCLCLAMIICNLLIVFRLYKKYFVGIIALLRGDHLKEDHRLCRLNWENSKRDEKRKRIEIKLLKRKLQISKFKISKNS